VAVIGVGEERSATPSGQQTGSKRLKIAPLKHAQTLAGPENRMNRHLTSSFMLRPPTWPVTPEIAGSTPVAPVRKAL
jgi:hypothetical protein